MYVWPRYRFHYSLDRRKASLYLLLSGRKGQLFIIGISSNIEMNIVIRRSWGNSMSIIKYFISNWVARIISNQPRSRLMMIHDFFGCISCYRSWSHGGDLGYTLNWRRFILFMEGIVEFMALKFSEIWSMKVSNDLLEIFLVVPKFIFSILTSDLEDLIERQSSSSSDEPWWYLEIKVISTCYWMIELFTCHSGGQSKKYLRHFEVLE